MRSTIGTAFAVVMMAAAAAPAFAANAAHPYKNVDHKNDAGNDTGDSQVDKLNQQQLQLGMVQHPVTPAPVPETTTTPATAPAPPNR